MEINKQKDGANLTIGLDGRLDTNTAPELENELRDNLSDVTNLVLDLKNLAYLSSAGLRVILGAQKQMNKQGNMTVKNVNETVMEVFEVTGFSDILNIE